MTSEELVEALRGMELQPLRCSAHAVWYEAGYAAGRRRASVWRVMAAAAVVVVVLVSLRMHWMAGGGGMAQYVDKSDGPGAALPARDERTSVAWQGDEQWPPPPGVPGEGVEVEAVPAMPMQLAGVLGVRSHDGAAPRNLWPDSGTQAALGGLENLAEEGR